MRLLRDLRFQLSRLRQQVDSLIQNMALTYSYRQTAMADFNPHALLNGLCFGGSCALRNIQPYTLLWLFPPRSVMARGTWFAAQNFKTELHLRSPSHNLPVALAGFFQGCYNSAAFIVCLSCSLPGEQYDLSLRSHLYRHLSSKSR